MSHDRRACDWPAHALVRVWCPPAGGAAHAPLWGKGKQSG